MSQQRATMTFGKDSHEPDRATGKQAGRSLEAKIHPHSESEEAGTQNSADNIEMDGVDAQRRTLNQRTNNQAATSRLGAKSPARHDKVWTASGRKSQSDIEGTALSALDNQTETGYTGKSHDGPSISCFIIPAIKFCDEYEFEPDSPLGEDISELHCIDAWIQTGNSSVAFRDCSHQRNRPGQDPSPQPRQPFRHRKASINYQPSQWVQSIRINSPFVMRTLQRVCFESDDFGRAPVIFHRPFHALVPHYEDMKDQLAMLKPSHPPSFNNDDEGQDFHAESQQEPKSFHSRYSEMDVTEDAFEVMSCFLEFMEDRIMPHARKYRSGPSKRADWIRYEDLWHLFKPGDFVYVPGVPGHKSLFLGSPYLQSISRIVVTYITHNSPERLLPGVSMGDQNARSSVFLYHIDYNGAVYEAVVTSLAFSFFRGEKKVTELECYPISYLEDDCIMEQAKLDGATFISLVEKRSAFYNGWTLTRDTLGDAAHEKPAETPSRGPEHIDGDIIVDYKETFHAYPSWRAPFYHGNDWTHYTPPGGRPRRTVDFEYCDTIETHNMIKTFTREHGPGLPETPLNPHYSRCITTDYTEWKDMIAFAQKDEFGILSTGNSAGMIPTGQSLALLPRRFFGYSVLERRFLELDIRCVRSLGLEAKEKTFENLEINPQHKRLILALVKSHFDKTESEKRTNVEVVTQDLIRGKGKGIVILLHGVPGVGKTATAEAVAQKWERPLFPITCGDLGYTAESLERSLREIFRLAHLWECILLLDEADIFVTRRERPDLKRNAIVSAFLRVLEYYNGVLFLTTNRPGVLDEAVKSRVHLNLHYDDLSEQQTIAIFKKNMDRLNEIEKQRNADPSEQIAIKRNEILKFAEEHFRRPYGRWNGRQIRNAFVIASSLVHYDHENERKAAEKDGLAQPNVKLQKQLGREQFETVAETTLLYDQYREAVHSGKSDDHVAAEREERATPSHPIPQTPDRLKDPSKSYR